MSSIRRDPALPPHADIFEAMRKQDILLHHPYESYDPVVELVESAAKDPLVLAIRSRFTGRAAIHGLSRR